MEVPSYDGNFMQMSPKALDWIYLFLKDESIKREGKILEFGSGASTIWFAQTFPNFHIYSIEGDPKWFDLVNEWIEKYELENVTHLLYPQTNYYTSVNENNLEYIQVIETLDSPFDFILNDGGMREIVGDYILANPKNFIAPGGIYLRHDYERYTCGDWRGFHLGKEIRYEQFVLDNPEYDLITVNGDGKWGYKAELGGVWHRT